MGESIPGHSSGLSSVLRACSMEGHFTSLYPIRSKIKAIEEAIGATNSVSFLSVAITSCNYSPNLCFLRPQPLSNIKPSQTELFHKTWVGFHRSRLTGQGGEPERLTEAGVAAGGCQHMEC